ncbi:MAG: hypothetical protein EXR75_09315 [Myxococcales bacterium]|nr:hypothetical protein [Myxococcales bacterium]
MWRIASIATFATLAAFPWACIDTSGASHTTVAASTSTTGSGGAGGGGNGDDPLAGADCDPMVPTQCGFPFPSNVWLRDDSSTVTKKRVHFGLTTLPVMIDVGHIDRELLADRDGFSPAQAPMTHMPGATETGLPTQDDIDLSLSLDSPTILIEAETGTPVPHHAEIDANGETREEGALMLRPAVRLKDATRYIVAIRRVRDEAGEPLLPNPIFKALRDGTPHEDRTVGARRKLYEDIFARLSMAGYATDDLQLAWDYTTASRDDTTRWLLHMRDDALKVVGDLGPEYTVTEVTENPNEHLRRRIRGKMKVPLYLDTSMAGGQLVFGEDGLPKQNGFGEFDFVVHVPHAATTGTPGALLQNGHGLLGSMNEGQNGYLAKIANAGNFVAFSVPLVGMASEDEATIQLAIVSDFGLFKGVIGRQHQGIVNSLLAMRMMAGRFVNDPNVQFDGKSAIDPTSRFYRGDSQGGIFGATYMAITTDVERGLLGEPGMPYNLLLNRSVDFEPFFIVLKAKFKNMRDIQVLLGATQMLWDRTEPSGYLPYLSENLLPNTPAHQVLLHVAIGDYQVTPLGAHIMARTLGARNITPANRDIWGVASSAAPYQGNAIVEFDFGLPDVPKKNVPPTGPDFPEDGDPHDKVRALDSAMAQSITWLRTGVVEQKCAAKCDPE